MKFDRCKKLFGDDFKKLQNAKILVLGVGGVGGFLVECLAKSGVGSITIVDHDRFDETNQNRQLYAEFVGEKKVEVFSKKFESIEPIFAKVDKEWVDSFDFEKFDLVVDAIDDISAKVLVAKKCSKKLISSMGSAKRVDPIMIEVKDIWKTYGDKLAKKFRYELKKAGFKGKFDVVFSPEEPKCIELGSFMAVTGSFGLTLCSLVIKRILS
jgi:tRNA A37 threonylcarbamoyladenosine dehydratase